MKNKYESLDVLYDTYCTVGLNCSEYDRMNEIIYKQINDEKKAAEKIALIRKCPKCGHIYDRRSWVGSLCIWCKTPLVECSFRDYQLYWSRMTGL